MKIGIIGTGAMGKNHIRVLRNIADVDEIIVSDINEENLKHTCKKFGIEKSYLDYNDLLRKEKLDGVIIATQPDFHKETAINSMTSGINVLVEKPIAHNLKDAEEMKNVAEKYGVIFTVGHTERFNPVISKIREFINSKSLNNVYLVNTHRVGPFPKRLLGNVEGVLIDLAVHDFDIINFLCGRIQDIQSQIIRLDKQEIYVKTLMDLENKVKASSEFSWISPRMVRTIEIYAEEGMFLGDYYNQEVWLYENDYYDDISKSTNPFFRYGLIKSGKVIKYPIYKQEPLLLELTNFVNAIQGSENIFVKPEEAILALKNVLSII